MPDLSVKQKKALRCACLVLLFVLSALYIYAVFLPGIRYCGAFLYDKGGGVYAGSSGNISYKARIFKEKGVAMLDFSVNEEKKNYSVEKSGSSVKIFCDGEKMFFGTVQDIEGIYILTDENGNADMPMRVYVNGEPQHTDELFPQASEVYKITQSGAADTRGEPAAIILIFILLVILALDIRFPLLFFKLNHGLFVDGGEPSDWYYTSRRLGHAAVVIILVIIVIYSFKL